MQNRKVEKMQKKAICLGFYDRGTGKHQSNTVFSFRGGCPTITTAGTTASQQIKVVKRWRKRSSESDKQAMKEVKPAQ